jgi:copper homeostasis protein (lipoprotein)
MKKILFTFLGAAMLLVVAFFWLNSYIYNEKQGDTSEPEHTTLTGEYMCLPLAEEGSADTGDCAVGIKTEYGDYYAIDLGLMSMEAPALVEGDMIRAAGIITPIAELSTDYWKKYPVIGIFSVTDSLELLEPEKQEPFASYEGVLPCASCEGIVTQLELSASPSATNTGEYVLTEIYIGQDESEPFVTKGSWMLKDEGGVMTYELQKEDGVIKYIQLDQSMIRMVGADGSAFPSELPYNLKKIEEEPNPVLDTSWVWKETILLNGTVVTPSKPEAFVLMLGSDRSYTSSTDCNALSGTFALDQEVLSFSPAISTKMFCEGSQESVYIEELMLANSFAIKGDELHLNLNRDFGTMKFVKKQ